MNPFARNDHRYVWHPFTQMRDWLRQEPIVIASGRGSVLQDTRGRRYLDANASIWTNLHGHRHPKISQAIARQLRRIAHSSALGLANEPASVLAARLVQAAQPPGRRTGRDRQNPADRWTLPLGGTDGTPGRLERVFFSDDGSTAIEVALKLAYEYARRNRGDQKPRFLSLQGAYHGDTIGAVSLGHLPLFHQAYGRLLFAVDAIPAPYCYRCPYNRAKPAAADARSYRVCHWECVRDVEAAMQRRRRQGQPYAALVVEPRIQGAAGMIPQPDGWLRRVAGLAREHGTQLIADEVMTGFGRTGRLVNPERGRERDSLFACHHEQVQPDYLVLAKGLTGGYLPMAATLTTGTVFSEFLGDYAEAKTFFHGHSYTGNQLGAAAACANLEVLSSDESRNARKALEFVLRRELAQLWALPWVGDVRQVGLVAGIELVRDRARRTPFAFAERLGGRVCEAMAHRGVLTRPIGNVIVLMPPYCTTARQVAKMVQALAEACEEVLGTSTQRQ